MALQNNYSQFAKAFTRLLIFAFISYSSANGSNDWQKQLQRLQLKIGNDQGYQLFPFNPEDHSLAQCGASKRITFKSKQILSIQSNKPFIAMLESNNTKIRMSGYAESVEVSDSKHTGLFICEKSCLEYFSALSYTTYLSIYIKQPSKSQMYRDIEQPIQIPIPSHAYCLEQRDLIVLQGILDFAYGLLWASLAAFLPIYPQVGFIPLIITLALIVFSQLTSEFESAIITVLYLFLMYELKDSPIDNINFSMKGIKMMVRRALASLYLLYFMTNFIKISSYPVYNEEPKWTYIVSIYTRNIAELLIIAYAFSSVFWINRIRGLFWYLVCYTIFFSFIWERLDHTQNFLKLTLPSLFSQTCNHKSIVSLIGIMPVCQFMDRFSKVKLWSFFILMILTLVTNYSYQLASVVVSSIIACSLIADISQNGEFQVFSRRWLTNNQVQSLALW